MTMIGAIGAFARMRIRAIALVGALALVALGVACGGEEPAAPGAVGSGSPEERIAALEARAKGFEEFMVAQSANAAAAAEAAEDESGFLDYKLEREAATENERNIVRWMAECSARGYLHPGLPEQVLEREITEREELIWTGLAEGQYSSFNFLIGIVFTFCEADLVEEGS